MIQYEVSLVGYDELNGNKVENVIVYVGLTYSFHVHTSEFTIDKTIMEHAIIKANSIKRNVKWDKDLSKILRCINRCSRGGITERTIYEIKCENCGTIFQADSKDEVNRLFDVHTKLVNNCYILYTGLS